MATQTECPASTVPSAQIVGNAFVEQYYHILHHSPELVYKFYHDSSILSRQEPNGMISSVTTMQAINEKILSLDSKNYKAEIKTADAQDSHQAGVILLVTGCLTGKDNVSKKFTQTFFLAPQEKGYFVLNDIFRYVEENESLENNSTSVNGINDAPPAVLPSDPEPIHVPDHSTFDPATTAPSEEQNGAEVCDPSDNEEEGSVIEEEVVNEPQAHQSQNETSAVDNSDPSAAQDEKKSYASIVKVTKAATSTIIPYAPTRSTQVGPAKSDQQAVGSEKPSPAQDSFPPSNDNVPESYDAHEEGYSIYVRNLPSNATPAQLEEVFKKFGLIKRNGIQVRSNKQGFCFGFVEFESNSSMQNAIESSPITIGGRQAVVEEKRTTTRVVSNSRGRYPSGRGGFRNENFRGRGNFGGGRGYGRNEFRNQAEFSIRSKGPGGRNVETYRRVDQNENGRQGGMNKNAVSA
ncbi:PREDICTED: putative G3BP-like protein isoform X2 [Ipomoea nil]|uniref:putative G3BP-like protein isoform X2 n=1 Tax=Ipomoea nil TaxID=35883 RepID=UPI0009013D51|nr:PREDICTED: putative G3BP-like protein isoform X2 [Ipomoea nil]